jgi:hypothetical protein
LVALADAAHNGAASLEVGSAIHFLKAQDARERGDAHDEVPMKPTMYERLAIAMIKALSRRQNALAGDGGDNKSLWSLELASA